MQKFPILTTLPVQWGEMDSYQHVNNGVYLRYAEAARLGYISEIVEDDIMTNNGITKDGVGLIIAGINIKFKAPVTFPDEVIVGAYIKEIGTDYFAMHQCETISSREAPSTAFFYHSSSRYLL